MKRLSCLVLTIGLTGVWHRSVIAGPLRGLELHPDAPASVVKTFARCGVNTLVIPFRKQGDLADPAFVKSLARWGKLAKRHKLRCLVAVRLFGPPDYTGSKGGFVRAVEAIAASPCVSPGDANYWAQVVTPRVRRIAELAKQNGLGGALFDYQATLTGSEYGAAFCFSTHCWNAFVKAKHDGDEKIMKLKTRAQRVNWVRSSPRGGQYYAFLSELVQTEMTKSVQAARSVFPEMVLGIYGYSDAWLYHGVVRATSQPDGQDRPPAVLAEYERTTFGRVYPLVTRGWQTAGLRFQPVVRLPLDYYLPNDVANHLAELDRDQVGFLLTSTDALWRRVADVFHVHPPNGSASAFAAAVREGLSGRPAGQRVFHNKRYYAQYLPRLGVVHGKGLSGLFSGLIKRLATSFQLPTVQLAAAHPDRWLDALSACDVVIALPGAGSANPKGLAAAAPAVERLVRNGGILILLNAADPKEVGWFTGHASRFALEGERKSGLKQAWLANEGDGLLATPAYIETLAPGGAHFKSFSPKYMPLAKDDQGGAYLLAQHVGRGLLIASAGALIPVELLANAYFSLTRRGECFTVELLPGPGRAPCGQEIAFGRNDLLLGVAELPEFANRVNVFVDVIDTNGKTAAHRFFDVSVAGDGLRIPLRYIATDEGAGRIVVTITDPVDNALLRRVFIPLLHDQRVEILPDKNYYTTEPHAVLRLCYFDKSLREATVEVRLAGNVLKPKPTGRDVRFAKIPIGDLEPGEHKLQVSFMQEGKAAYTKTLTLRKERPFPTAVKILHHRSCVLEVGGKPFFPFGCYGGQDAGLDKLGANTAVGGPGKDGKLRFAPHGIKPADELRGDDYKMLLSWYRFDEPALNSHSPEHVLKTYQAGRAKDPYHPQMIVYVGSATYPHYPDYMPSADCHMMDHYPRPFFATGEFGYFLRKVTRAARGRRNVWAVPQCFDWREIGAGIGPYKSETLHPQGPEALNYIYQAIVDGAGAITFWTHRYIAADPRRYEPFKKALAEGAKLSKLVARGTVVQPPRVKPLCAQVRCRSFKIGKEIYIVAANYLARKADVEFSAPYLKGKTLRQYLPGQRKLGALTDTFEPLEGKVYVITTP